MGLYQDYVVPCLVRLLEYRRRVVPHARGRVLEIGVGSGMNVPLYTKRCVAGHWARSVPKIGLDGQPLLEHSRAPARVARRDC
jgi:hypothetical protein